MALVKKLTKIGNSWGVILPTDILRLVGLEPGGEYEIEVEEGQISIHRPKWKIDVEETFKKALAKFTKKYQKDLKKLAEDY